MHDEISEREAAEINERMVQEMERRRQQRAERRQGSGPVTNERRKICAFCFQPGDHRTPAHCLRALERS